MKRRTLLGSILAAAVAPQAIAASSDQRIMQSLASTLEFANKIHEIRTTVAENHNLSDEVPVYAHDNNLDDGSFTLEMWAKKNSDGTWQFTHERWVENGVETKTRLEEGGSISWPIGRVIEFK